MADAGGLRQTGGARSVDQQRAVVDGDAASLVRRQRTSIHSIEGSVDTCFVAMTAMNPDFRRAVQMRQRRLEDVREIVRQNDMIGSATLMQWDSDNPTSLVLISATTPPTLLMPSQAAM